MVVSLTSVAALLSIFWTVSAFVQPSVGGTLQARALRNAAPATTSRISMAAGSRVENVAAVLLAGGVGKRMAADMPKQFLQLDGETVLEHSLRLFLKLKGVSQLILVLDEQYRPMLQDLKDRESRLVFADPGTERQDSVYNALQKVDVDASLVCIHDTARPLVTKASVYRVIADADAHGAAVLGVPMKATVKESADGQFVHRTIDRSRLWDIQTPQVVKTDILKNGFMKVMNEGLAVTDDVSIVEHLGLPVKLTMGEYTNLKLTTPEDLVVAAQIMEARRKDDLENGGADDDDEYEGGKQSISKIRADEKWTDAPRPIGDAVEDVKESISARRANERWSDKGSGSADRDDEPLVNLSKLRAG